MDFKVLYRFLTIKKMEEVNRNFKSRFHDNKNQNQKPKLSGYENEYRTNLRINGYHKYERLKKQQLKINSFGKEKANHL